MSNVLGGFELGPEPDDGLESVEVEAEDADTPPDPVFLIQKDFYGKGTERVARSDGEAVGLWLERVHPSLSGPEVQELLLSLGLDETRSAWFGGHRAKAIESRSEIAASPAYKGLGVAEARAQERTELVREAFLKQQQKK